MISNNFYFFHYWMCVRASLIRQPAPEGPQCYSHPQGWMKNVNRFHALLAHPWQAVINLLKKSEALYEWTYTCTRTVAHAYTCTCTVVYPYIYTRTIVYAYTSVYTCTYECPSMCTYTTSVHKHAHTCTSTTTCLCTYMCT